MSKLFKKVLIVLCSLGMAAGCIALKDALNTDREPFNHLLFSVQYDTGVQSVNCWLKRSENQYYIFLPSFFSGNAEVHFNSKLLLKLDDKKIKNGSVLSDIPLSTPVSACFYDKSNNLVEEATLIFMASSNVPSMHITSSSGSMDKINADKSYREEGRMFLVTSDGKSEYNGLLKYIHARGNSTFKTPKKPYTIKLSSESDLLDMGKGTNWVLLANYYDPSNIKNKLVYDMGKECGLAYSPDSRFVDLYLNNEYVGLYLLCEKIEIGEHRVNIENLGAATEQLNVTPLEEFDAFKTSNELGSQKGFLINRNPSDITGGYIFQFEVPSRYSKDPSGVVTSRGQSITINSPQYASAEQATYAKNLLQDLEDAIFSSDGVSPTTGKSYLEYIDLDSWVKQYLIEEISKNFDSAYTSQYFYKDSDSNDSKIYAGPMWDYDSSLGVPYITEDPIGLFASQVNRRSKKSLDGITPTWFSSIYLKEDFYNAVAEKYEETFLPILHELIKYKIDDYVNYISASCKADSIRWKKATAEEGCASLKEYLSTRTSFLTSIWIDKDEYCTITGYIEKNAVNIFFTAKKGDCVTDLIIPQWDNHTFKGWYYVSNDTEFDITRPITEDIRIYAKWEEDSVTSPSEQATVQSDDINTNPSVLGTIQNERYVPIILLCFFLFAFFVFYIYRNRFYKIKDR